MKIQAAASLTCLLLLGGCTYSSLVTKLSTKPEPPRATAPARPASTHSAAPATDTAPARNTTPATATTTHTTAEPQAALASQIADRMALGIPPEEIPSPGECRVWLPELPLDQQSAPGQCSVVQQRVPAGAWVLHRSEEKTDEVAVNVYRSRWPHTVAETRYFDYWTGRFLRAE